jgi:hypothetical protein
MSEITAGELLDGQPAQQSGKDPSTAHSCAFGDNPREQMLRLGSDCQSNAELARAGTHGECQHARDADDGDCEGHQRKAAKNC